MHEQHYVGLSLTNFTYVTVGKGADLSWTVSWQCRNMYTVSALCRSGFYHAPTTTPTSDQIADTSSCPDSGPGIYIVSPWSL